MSYDEEINLVRLSQFIHQLFYLIDGTSSHAYMAWSVWNFAKSLRDMVSW